MKVVGVIGAGVIGIGVAQNLAQAGFKVKLIDVEREILENAKLKIYDNLRFQSFFNKGEVINVDEVVRGIEFTTNYNSLADADFIIENTTEKWEVKKDIYPVIDKICPKHTIFAVNTSCIPITQIAALTKRPDKVIGIHFMNPVPLKSTVEVVRGYHTNEITIEMTHAMLASMNKTGIVVNDMPGFVSNRVLMLTINEAIFLVQDQVSCPEDIDKIFKECFGHKMGPLETCDLIGLDTILFSIEALYEAYNDSKYRPSPLLRKMVNAGLLGRKNGQGFYKY